MWTLEWLTQTKGKGSVWNLLHFSAGRSQIPWISSESGGLSETDQGSTWLQSSLKINAHSVVEKC